MRRNGVRSPALWVALLAGALTEHGLVANDVSRGGGTLPCFGCRLTSPPSFVSSPHHHRLLRERTLFAPPGLWGRAAVCVGPHGVDLTVLGTGCPDRGFLLRRRSPPATPMLRAVAGGSVPGDDGNGRWERRAKTKEDSADSGSDLTSGAGDDLFSSSHDGEIIMIGGQRFERRGRALVNLDVGEQELHRVERVKRQSARDPFRKVERDVVDFYADDVEDDGPSRGYSSGRPERRGRRQGRPSMNEQGGRGARSTQGDEYGEEKRPWVVKRASETDRARSAKIEGLGDLLVGRTPPPAPEDGLLVASMGAGGVDETLDALMGKGGALGDDELEDLRSSGEEGARDRWHGSPRDTVGSEGGAVVVGGDIGDSGSQELPELVVEEELLFSQDRGLASPRSARGGGGEGPGFGEGAGAVMGADDSVIMDYAEAIEEGGEGEGEDEVGGDGGRGSRAKVEGGAGQRAEAAEGPGGGGVQLQAGGSLPHGNGQNIAGLENALSDLERVRAADDLEVEEARQVCRGYTCHACTRAHPHTHTHEWSRRHGRCAAEITHTHHRHTRRQRGERRTHTLSLSHSLTNKRAHTNTHTKRRASQGSRAACTTSSTEFFLMRRRW